MSAKTHATAISVQIRRHPVTPPGNVAYVKDVEEDRRDGGETNETGTERAPFGDLRK